MPDTGELKQVEERVYEAESAAREWGEAIKAVREAEDSLLSWSRYFGPRLALPKGYVANRAQAVLDARQREQEARVAFEAARV